MLTLNYALYPKRKFLSFAIFIGVFLFLSVSDIALAQSLADPSTTSGDTSWMLTATIVVLFMVLPGLLLLNAGSKSGDELFASGILIFTSVATTTVVWGVYGYSAAFGNGDQYNDFIGSLDHIFLNEYPNG